jgi:hypothetical protein
MFSSWIGLAVIIMISRPQKAPVLMIPGAKLVLHLSTTGNSAKSTGLFAISKIEIILLMYASPPICPRPVSNDRVQFAMKEARITRKR